MFKIWYILARLLPEGFREGSTADSTASQTPNGSRNQSLKCHPVGKYEADEESGYSSTNIP
jgi:hypothetical protein